jgi:hypothetical protein
MERFYRRKRSKTKKQPNVEHSDLTAAFKESKCTDVLTDTFFQTSNRAPRLASTTLRSPSFSSLAAETRREGSCEKIILPFIILRTNSPLKTTRIFGRPVF